MVGGTLSLSTLAFAEFAAGDDAAADADAFVRMRQHADAVGVNDVILPRPQRALSHRIAAQPRPARAGARGPARAAGVAQRETLPRPWIAATLPRARALLLVEEGEVDGAPLLEELVIALPAAAARARLDAARPRPALAGRGGGARQRPARARRSRSSSGSARPAGPTGARGARPGRPRRAPAS